MQLKDDQVHVHSTVQRMQVVPNRPKSENGRSCSFQEVLRRRQAANVYIIYINSEEAWLQHITFVEFQNSR